ncbi:MAG: hypothetical protein PHG89_11030 [Gallionella sp.]|nr:hypothetical protein [Gallionella sp.]
MRVKRWKKQLTGVDPLDFSPGLLRIQAQPSTPFARALLYSLLGLLLIWAIFEYLLSPVRGAFQEAVRER